MKVSIVIVNYNGGPLLANCVRSVVRHAPPFALEIVIVDNQSHDDSVALVRTEFGNIVSIMELGENKGFAAANNIGARAATGDVLFFLNPDTELQSTDIWRHFAALDDQRIYTSRLLDSDGKEYGNVSVVPTFGNYFKKIFGGSPVLWAQGSVIIMKRSTFEAVGGWAEDYFMYSEDLDLFFKSAQLGVRLEQLDAAVMHIGGGTTATVWSTEKRQERVERAYYRFSRKYNLLFDYHLLHLIALIRGCIARRSTAWMVFSVYLRVLKSPEK